MTLTDAAHLPDDIETRRRVIVAIFALQAIASGGIFTRIPDIQQALGLSEAGLGLVLMAPPVGGFASFFVSSYLIERSGTRLICLLAIPVLALTSAIFAWAPAVGVAVAALLLYGVSFSIVNVAMNVEADRIEALGGRRIMNTCHGFWSIGFLGAALIGAFARGNGIGAALHLGAVAVVTIAVAVRVVAGMRASPERKHKSTVRKVLNMPSAMTFKIVGFGLIGGMVQGGTNNWSVIYMRDSFAAADWVDTLTIPAFLVMLTVGRLFGDSWVGRFGVRAVALAMTWAALAGVVLVIVSPAPYVSIAGFALMGVGVSIVFPLMVSAAARIGDRPASANVAAVTMTTGVAMLVVPPVMGFVAEAAGIRAAYAALLPGFVLAFLCVRYIVPRTSED